jgi:hypothetical protein
MAFALSTTAGIGVGTISIARNSNTVTGVGTNFTSPSLVNQIILVNGFNSRVTAVASATSMTINRVPSFDITGETFSFVTAATVINQSGADTDPSGLSAILGVNTVRVGIQAVYELGVLRLATTGAAATFSYDGNRHCIVWSNQITAPELTNGSGRIITITGARTDGTYTAPFYPRALAMPRVLPAGDSTYLPAHRSIVNNGTLNISGIWFDTNQVADLGGTATITNCKWSSTDQQANFRMSAANITINGLDLHNMPLTLLQSAALGALNGLRFYNSGYTPVSLPAVAATNPRIYTDWNFLGALPLMNNFSGNANYVEFRNFGNWAGFKLATNSAVNMAARFVKNVSVNVLDTLGVGITGAIVYRLDTNNGSRVTYTADEHFIQSTVSGAATGRILAQIGRLPAGAANNSTQYTAFMDCRNAANDQTGNDVLRYVSYDHLLANRNVNTKGIGTLTSEQTLFNDTSVTLSRTNAIAKLASSFTVDPVTKIVTVTANSSFDDVYDALKAYKATANALNLATPTLDTLIVTPNGTSLEAYTGWSLVVNTGVTLSSGVKFNTVEFDAVTINGTGLITGVYQTLTGTSTVLQLNPPSNGYSLCIFKADGTTKYFASNVNAGSYYVYFTPSEAGTYYLAAENYGQKRTTDTLVLSGGNVWYNITDQEDVGITVTNKATVAAYTTIDNYDEFYDYTAYKRLEETYIKLGQIATRDGLNLNISAPYSVKVNQSAASVYNLASNIFTIKTNTFANGVKFTNMILVPPATLAPTTNELLTGNWEDANGDSSIDIQGALAPFSIYKFPITTPFPSGSTDDRLDPAFLIATITDRKYRFINDPAYNYFVWSASKKSGDNIPNISEGQTAFVAMTKGAYTAYCFQGAEIQLVQAPKVDLIYNDIQSVLLDTDAIKGTGFTKDVNSLTNITEAIETQGNDLTADLTIINNGVKKASIFVPHSQNLS